MSRSYFFACAFASAFAGALGVALASAAGQRHRFHNTMFIPSLRIAAYVQKMNLKE
jgi:purine-cytosine permease-like protein